jgi:hypothetical protein
MPAALYSSGPDSTQVNSTVSRQPVVDTTTHRQILPLVTGARPAPMGSTASLGVRRNLCRCSTPPSPRPVSPPRAPPSDPGGRARPGPRGSSSAEGRASLSGHRGELPRPSPSSDKEPAGAVGCPCRPRGPGHRHGRMGRRSVEEERGEREAPPGSVVPARGLRALRLKMRVKKSFHLHSSLQYVCRWA